MGFEGIPRICARANRTPGMRRLPDELPERRLAVLARPLRPIGDAAHHDRGLQRRGSWTVAQPEGRALRGRLRQGRRRPRNGRSSGDGSGAALWDRAGVHRTARAAAPAHHGRVPEMDVCSRRPRPAARPACPARGAGGLHALETRPALVRVSVVALERPGHATAVSA